MPDDMTPTFAAALVDMMAGIEPLVETTTGYRKTLEESGYSPTAAEQIAAELHIQMIRFMFTTMTTTMAQKK